jgi:DNA-binding transcriptional ArsR family regulator
VLADPTRRTVLERLRSGPRAVHVIAAGLPVSRHLRTLKDAGLVAERREGARRICSLPREGLVELRDWLDRFGTTRLKRSAAKPSNANNRATGVQGGLPATAAEREAAA